MRLLYRMVGLALALVLLGAMGLLTARPSLGEGEQEAMAKSYGFTELNLNTKPKDAKSGRAVAPDLEHFRSWISSVGAGVALTDMRGNGRAADACLIDPRDDSLTLRHVPGSQTPSYQPAKLEPTGLAYDKTMAPMGCVPADFDEDGDHDILAYYWGRSPVLYLNTAGPKATPKATNFQAHELVSPTEIWNTTAVNVADMDGDGHLDILIGNYFPDQAKVLDPRAANDSHMEMQQSMSLASNGGNNRVLLTEPTGKADSVPRITDASAALPEHVAQAWTLAIGFQDLTGNGLPDIYQGNDFGNDHLLVNESTPGNLRLTPVRGQRDMTTPKSKVLGNGSFKGMGIAFTYNDGNKLPMMTVSNITSPYALHESNFAFVPTGKGTELLDGKVPFRDESEQLGLSRSGWSWDVKSGDFNNDGTDELFQATGFIAGETKRWAELQEIAMGNDQLLQHPDAWTNVQPGDELSGHEHNPFWVRGKNGRYTDLAQELGIAAPHVSRAYSFGDINGDGLLDAVVANQWQNSKVLLNTAKDAHRGINLRLVRPAADGTGDVPTIGATVRTRDGVNPAQTRQLYPANGHVGVSADTVHMAAGSSGTLPVTITWRDERGTHKADVELPAGAKTVELNENGTAVLR